MSTTLTVEKPLLADYVAKDPQLCFGKPCIKGTRIRVQDIYSLHEEQGKSIAEIVQGWPHLTQAQVYGALAYAWEYHEEILGLLKEEDEAHEMLQSHQPTLTQKALARLHAQSA